MLSFMLVLHGLIALGLIKERKVSQWSVLSACNEAMLDGHQLGVGSRIITLFLVCYVVNKVL